MDFARRTAVITGASTGIGAAFARELAARGARPVLVARSEDRLTALAAELDAAHGVRPVVLARDLAAPGAAAELERQLTERELTVDLLVNNAGFGTHGPLGAADPDRIAEQVGLNCLALTELTTRLLPGMLARRRGAIVNLASTAAFQPLPGMAVYGATKAYVLSFTEALAHELRGTGVRALAICPGATETPFFAVMGGEVTGPGGKRTPEQVVGTALRALARGRASRVDGLLNRLTAASPRLLPRRAVPGVAARFTRVRELG
ncbi:MULTISPECIES: SDR family oxidoreductase [Kitasatospora]|uniref:Putative oxidoreductase n=1 Tax=Kitasatospora setae (strain ATCC 33774 / DSM 43861 / JCM 3304 / KCC A-0304 / NBRC 14216 / KM-6054) TaxID=452652 RepID=E4NHW0_KITSK|nr:MULTISPECIES: SDR family oxidoreductase [Kitasatospora]BAJ31090.1 putative oxidoreductase [Kitasatospora setae KM-6054]